MTISNVALVFLSVDTLTHCLADVGIGVVRLTITVQFVDEFSRRSFGLVCSAQNVVESVVGLEHYIASSFFQLSAKDGGSIGDVWENHWKPLSRSRFCSLLLLLLRRRLHLALVDVGPSGSE